MSKEAAADVSVIIVNYGTADLALDAVASVLALDSAVRDIHVVDNASPNDDAAHLAHEIAERGWQGRVTLHAETVNHGFGRGNNLVIEALAARPPRFVFLLNPDARLANAAISLLAETLDRHPEAAVAGARVERPGGIVATGAFRFPSLISVFSDSLSFGPVARRLARWTVPLPPDQPSGPVDWVVGAAMLIRWEALQQVGGFDPGFFLYYEEVDLMRQFARRGWNTIHVTEAQVIHAEGVATGVNSHAPERRRRPAYWYQSWEYYFRKNHGRAYALAAAAAWIAGAALNHVICRIRGKRPAAPLGFFGDFWRVACRPLLGLKSRPQRMGAGPAEANR